MSLLGNLNSEETPIEEILGEAIDITEEESILDPNEIISEDFGFICKQDGVVVAYGFWKGTRANNERIKEWAEAGYEKTADKYVQGYDGKFYIEGTEPEKPTEKKQAEVRTVRNSYLKQYVDDRAKSPFMWDEVPEEEKVLIGEYRKYLMDYPEQENWWDSNPLTFEEWKEELNATEQITTMGDVYGTNTSV